MASNTQGGLGAMFSGISDGYMTGSNLQRAMAEKQRADQEELAQQQREQEAQRRAEAGRQQQQLQQTPQPQSQPGMGGVDPGTLLSVGSAFGTSGTTAGGAAAGGSAAGGSAAGGTAAGGTSALGGAAAAAGPWAALAAIVGVNERSARNSGARRDGVDYWKDLGTGKVVEQDVNQRIVPKIFGGYNDDKTGLAHEAGAAGEFATLDFKNGAKKLENGVVGNLVKKIF